MENKINRIRETALGLVHHDSRNLSFVELLVKDNNACIEKNLQTLAIEIFKAKQRIYWK